ncbi:hypothetical protein PMIN01_11796 [Paraphaeosphaeria minitans]|uniref:Uncharacterized protein n=1 Tax=Paraphaeosphaeria minitans TaxID=565426 RepID=A0A9P6KJX8_9PLEO|nr:hypothetical protein PMIN01_11796 [Paraphaeosphaeria minitans]
MDQTMVMLSPNSLLDAEGDADSSFGETAWPGNDAAETQAADALCEMGAIEVSQTDGYSSQTMELCLPGHPAALTASQTRAESIKPKQFLNNKPLSLVDRSRRLLRSNARHPTQTTYLFHTHPRRNYPIAAPVLSSQISDASSLDLFRLERRREPTFAMTDTASLRKIGFARFYEAIPVLDNANRAVHNFIQISEIAKNEASLPLDEAGAEQWRDRQTFHSSMIAAKLTENAAQRIDAYHIDRVQSLIRAVRANFKPEGSGTYVTLQRRLLSVTRQ